MLRFHLTSLRYKTVRKPLAAAGLLCLLLAGAGQAQVRSPATGTDPESLLIEVYKELGANNLRAAQEKADKLVVAYPNFQLGRLVRGDLLLMHTQPVKALGYVDGPSDKLKNLRAEAGARLRALSERPGLNMLPRAVLQMRDDQKHVLLVDAKRSRLFVYANQGGQPKFVADYYISQGKLGVDKLKEGDQKTPLGVYYITSHLSGARLPEFYGSGALPLNYPNEWDRLKGRGGSGIWLHGTPPENFSRPPLSSDGCVVLTNPDLRTLANTVEVGKTPVIISESVDFIDKSRWESERALATRLVENWRRDMESQDPDRLLANYASSFATERGENLTTWFSREQRALGNAKQLSIRLRDVTQFFYPGRDDLIVSTFTQDTANGRNTSTTRKRQYWAKQGGHWKIVYELKI